MSAQSRPLSGSEQANPASGPPDIAGLMDRAGFDYRLGQQWVHAVKLATPVALLLIDVDHFGAYVRSHTSQGAERLGRIAQTLAGCVFRPTDVVARYGDDEFAILLPGLHEGGARIVAARVRSLVNALAMPHSAGEGGIVTVSIGVAALVPGAGVAPQALVDLCEGALDQAKRMGRDSIVSQDWMA